MQINISLKHQKGDFGALKKGMFSFENTLYEHSTSKGIVCIVVENFWWYFFNYGEILDGSEISTSTNLYLHFPQGTVVSLVQD